ncbi:transmembrane emp24 domain-containing protein p24delta3-like [Wolffia australiana]
MVNSAVFLLFLGFTQCHFWKIGGVALELPKHATKCLSEDIHAHSIVLGDYSVLFDEHIDELPTVSAKITSPYGNTLHDTKNVSHGQFAFTTTEGGHYVFCFWQEFNPRGVKLSVNMDLRTGVAAKDWDSIAKKEKIEGVELELRKLEFQVQAIHDNLIHLRNKEDKMREVSEGTNARVAWLGIMSLGVCMGASMVQVWNLKKFFRRKRLI